MNPWMLQIKKIAKIMISYTIEGEEKVYRVKGTPFCVKKRYTKHYHQALEQLPIKPNKIVFDNYMGKGYGGNCKYVAEQLLKMGEKLDLVWMAQSPKEQQNQFPPGVRLVKYGSPEAMYEYATARVWVCNYHLVHYLNKGLLKKAGQSYIQMWHGSFGIKKIENDCGNLTKDKAWLALAKKNAQYTDFWISNSDFETEIYRRAFWDVRDVRLFGHPRNDIFFGNGLKRARQKAERMLGLNGYQLLLYVPTFRDDRMRFEQKLDYTLLKKSLESRFGGDWRILIRLHPRMRDMTDLLPSEEFCVNVTKYPDIQELLAAADAVVTDYSSAVFDYLLTGRPAFLYAPDYDAYETMRGLYYPLAKTPFSVALDNEQLAKHIASFDELVYKEKGKKFLEEKGSVEDGNAAAKVAGLILDQISQKENDKQKDKVKEYGIF